MAAKVLDLHYLVFLRDNGVKRSTKCIPTTTAVEWPSTRTLRSPRNLIGVRISAPQSHWCKTWSADRDSPFHCHTQFMRFSPILPASVIFLFVTVDRFTCTISVNYRSHPRGVNPMEFETILTLELRDIHIYKFDDMIFIVPGMISATQCTIRRFARWEVWQNLVSRKSEIDMWLLEHRVIPYIYVNPPWIHLRPTICRPWILMIRSREVSRLPGPFLDMDCEPNLRINQQCCRTRSSSSRSLKKGCTLSCLRRQKSLL